MNYSSLTCTVEERIACVSLNKPDRRNALDDTMIHELTEVLTVLNRNTDSRVVVLTGSGSAFCAGMDLDYLQRFSQLGQEENLEDARNLLRMLQLIANLKKPVIAMVNGPALGGGCGIAAACDFVYAGKAKAKLGVPEVRLGFVPAVILLFLIKRMGEGAAREFVLRGEVIDPGSAKVRGLVTEVVEDEELRPTVFAFAKQLAATTSPSSITLTKDLFTRIGEMSEHDVLEYAANLNALARKTADFKRGIDSFVNKEKLEW
jgi:methylglutaconyl-CoA hydratase